MKTETTRIQNLEWCLVSEKADRFCTALTYATFKEMAAVGLTNPLKKGLKRFNFKNKTVVKNHNT